MSELETLQTRVTELAQELEEAKVKLETSDDAWWELADKNEEALKASQQQVKTLTDALIQIRAQYKTELHMAHGDDIDLTNNIGINMAASALTAPASVPTGENETAQISYMARGIQQPETAVCPCAAEEEDNCEECAMTPEGPCVSTCTIPGCGGSSTLGPEEANDG